MAAATNELPVLFWNWSWVADEMLPGPCTVTSALMGLALQVNVNDQGPTVATFWAPAALDDPLARMRIAPGPGAPSAPGGPWAPVLPSAPGAPTGPFSCARWALMYDAMSLLICFLVSAFAA